MQIKWKNVLLMSGYTIEGVIRRENAHCSSAVAKELMAYYNAENGTKVPVVGQNVKIPVIDTSSEQNKS